MTMLCNKSVTWIFICYLALSILLPASKSWLRGIPSTGTESSSTTLVGLTGKSEVERPSQVRNNSGEVSSECKTLTDVVVTCNVSDDMREKCNSPSGSRNKCGSSSDTCLSKGCDVPENVAEKFSINATGRGKAFVRLGTERVENISKICLNDEMRNITNSTIDGLELEPGDMSIVGRQDLGGLVEASWERHGVVEEGVEQKGYSKTRDGPRVQGKMARNETAQQGAITRDEATEQGEIKRNETAEQGETSRDETTEQGETTRDEITKQGEKTDKTAARDESMLLYTCSGKCGAARVNPCSCVPTCVLYGTCCENITQDCPEIVQEGQKHFGRLLHSQVICEKVYMVSTCPGQVWEQPPRSVTKRLVDLLQSIPNGTVTADLARQWKEKTYQGLTNREILLAMVNAPITETTYGITFLNESIYTCNKDMIEGTEFIRWSTRLQYRSTAQNDGKILNAVNTYQPELDLAALAQNSCNDDVIKTCSNSQSGSETFSEDWRKCQEFTGIVFSIVNLTSVKYQNRFCAYCTEGREVHLSLYTMPGRSIRGHKLAVLASFTSADEFVMKVEMPIRKEPVSWSEITCPFSSLREEIEEDYQGKQLGNPAEVKPEVDCRVVCGDEGFTLKSDGICKATHYAVIGLADDSLEPLCRSALLALANYMSCSLHKLLSQQKLWRYSAFLQPSVSHKLDLRNNKTLYLTHLVMDLPFYSRGIFTEGAVKPRTLRDLFSVMMAGRQLWSGLDLCGDIDEGTRLTASYNNKVQSTRFEDFFNRMQISLEDIFGQTAGQDLEENDNVITVCTSPLSQSEPLSLQDLKCLDVANSSFNKSLVEDHLYSTCAWFLKSHYSTLNSNGSTKLGRQRILLPLTWILFSNIASLYLIQC